MLVLRRSSSCVWFFFYKWECYLCYFVRYELQNNEWQDLERLRCFCHYSIQVFGGASQSVCNISDILECITGQWACSSSPTCRHRSFNQNFKSAFSVRKFRRVAANSWRNMVCERGVDLVKPLHYGLFSKLLVLVVFLSINFAVCDCERIIPERCLIWGPGLNTDIVLPVRYFIIQAVNSKGENLTLSPGKLTTNTVTL